MKKTISVLQEDYAAIRAAVQTPPCLTSCAWITTALPPPSTSSRPFPCGSARAHHPAWDSSVCRAIEKAIQTSDIGINPQSDGKIIRITFPQLTEDRRKELAKEVSKMAEDAKVAVRNVRREAMDKLKAMKKGGDLTEDDLKQAEKKMQDLTDKYCKEVETVEAKKKKEIMEI